MLFQALKVCEGIWCGRVDSNHHGIATASPSSWCVCQFRHDRTEGVRLHCIRAAENGQGVEGFWECGSLAATFECVEVSGCEKREQNSRTPNYGLAGVAGAGCCGVVDCGAAGCCVAGAGAGLAGAGAGFENCCKIEPPCSTLRSTRTTNANAQIMNITAHHVVACESTVAAPRGPNAVWLPAPPKAPARSAALPLCSSTTTISTRQFSTKKIVSTAGNHRKPTAMIAKPTNSDITHFIQAGISCTSILNSNPRQLAGSSPPYRGQSFTILANDLAFRLAPPTSAPSSSSCAINP